MDLQLLWMLLKTVVCLIFILFLIYGSMKYGGSKLQNLQRGKYIKILERAPISKESSLLVVKIGEKGFVMASTINTIEIILELSKEEISEIQTSKTIPQYESLKDFYEKTGIKNIYERTSKNFYKKLKFKKEDKSNE